MTAQDWFVAENSESQLCPGLRQWDLIRDRYYFHRFLTEIIDLCEDAPQAEDEWQKLPQIRRCVRQLVTNSYWLQTQSQDPCPKTGLAIQTLYDEIGYPLTVQVVTIQPGISSPVHNHGTWGIVAILQGQEKHTFWRRTLNPQLPDQIAVVGEQVFSAGDIISFMPQAIHGVEAVGPEPTVTFQMYGDTQPRSRFEFDPLTHRAKSF